jgi:hypothetical protein
MARKVIPQLCPQPLLQHVSVLCTRVVLHVKKNTLYTCVLELAQKTLACWNSSLTLGFSLPWKHTVLFLNRYVQVKCGFVGEGKVRCLIFQLMDDVITDGPLCITLFRVKV